MKFHHIIVADTILDFAVDRDQYFISAYLPRFNVELRVYAWVDYEKNTANWRFLSLDTATGELTNDALAGFLPPNKIAPEGEGMVSYSVQHSQNLQDGDTIRNQALIYFDANEPIATNIWTNIIDDTAPVTRANLDFDVVEDTQIVISYSGRDLGSGIGRVMLYYSQNDSNWFPILDLDPDVPTDTLIGEPGTKYSFYTIGVDKLGNTESKEAIVEAQIFVPGFLPGEPFHLYPNPTTSFIKLTANETQGLSEFEIVDRSGKVVERMIQKNWYGSPWTIPVAHLAPGVYLINITTDKNKDAAALKFVKLPQE